MSASDPPEPFSLSHYSLPASVESTVARKDKSSDRLRFLQASDFRLDTPCHGVLDLPTELRDRFVDARYIAAERVFDTAIEQAVDFLVLPGGVLDAGLPGLRGPWFLTEQFSRLAEHGIQVYWAGSTFEAGRRWPAHARIPDSVHRLSADASVVDHFRDGNRIASLLTIPPQLVDTYRSVADPAFMIAVQPRTDCVPERWQAGIDFWALGGQPHHETEQVGKVIAHFAGSPQGRSPAESGRHSCSLVHVEADGSVHIEPIATNVVRWHHEHVSIDPSTTWSELERELLRHQAEIRVDPAAEVVMVHWTVAGSGLAAQRLLEPSYNAQLLGCLNADRSCQGPTFWSTEVEAIVETHEKPERRGTVSVLGEFLRELEGLSDHVEEIVGDANCDLDAARRTDTAASEQIMRHVINEGVHRLGTKDQLSTGSPS
jgi:DNA repair exonuclease SbcCD nuclease subunit